MSVNGVTSTQTQAATAYTSAAATTTVRENTSAENTSSANTNTSAGAVYEPTQKTATAPEKKIYKQDTNLINKLKADAEERTSQLRNLVEQMMGKQANTFANATDMWQFLRKGNYTVDAATKAQAQADISEDGYWGVKQTSDRIISFANALTGGDPSKIESMRAAFQKGYEKAEKAWGDKLPDISKQTYDAVMKKFDDLAAQANGTAAVEK